jgi:CHAT domain-containing protein/Tfp pilus assembly protein PilF
MIRALLITSLLAGAFAAPQNPWEDTTYRKPFNQFMIDGQYEEAEANARALLADYEKRFGPESVQTALALDMLTECYFYGDHFREAQAEEYARRAIAIKERVLGPDHPETALSIRFLAVLFETQGDYQQARTLFEKSVAVYDKVVAQDPRSAATAYECLGNFLTKTGDYGEARSALEQALAIRRKYFPPETLNTALILADYAAVLQKLGEYEKSRTNFLAAIGIIDRKMGPDHLLSTDPLNGLGALLNEMGKPADAKALLERTLAIEEKAYGPNHINLAFVLSDLAAANGALGDFATAKLSYQRAIAIATGVYGNDHPEVARILSGYAALLLRAGDTAGALGAALRTEEIGRNHIALTIRTLPERQALLYASTRGSALDLVLRIAVSQPSARRPAFDAVIRSRALVFDEMAARHHAVAHSGDRETARYAEALSCAREKLSQLVMRGPAKFHGTEYATALAQAQAEKDRAERALAQHSAAFREELASRSAGLNEVSSALAPGDAVVAFVRYSSDPAYLAFVLRAGADSPALIPLGPARSIEALIADVRREIQNEAESPGLSPARSEQEYRAPAGALRHRIWDPLEPALAGARRVFIIPDHALNLIDFAALPARRGGYLIEHAPLMHYVSAERDLVAKPATPSGQGLLAFGAPAFDRAPREPQLISYAGRAPAFRGSRSACSDFRTLRFDPLPGSAKEVHEISALWNKSGAGGVFERTGEAASGSAFKQNAPGKRVLHVAVHGFFLGETCASAPARVAGENPLLLSGLALAGANRRQLAPSGSEDGVITAEEIAAIDLEGVEWAVLSACETGLGKLLAGEGVFGLRRAFQVAGARTVIMSLWPVDDAGTRLWMNALYRKRFVEKLETAEAVRAAKLEILSRARAKGLSSHPFYWSGFIAAGDWR